MIAASAVAGFNGGLFVNPDLSPIEEKVLPGDVARDVIKMIGEAGLDPWLYAGNDWMVHRRDAPHVAREQKTVRFEPNETFATIFPIERGVVERFEPRFAPLASDPELERQFHAWSAARDAFHLRMQREPPANPADKWQKHYYRGVDIEGRAHVADHRPKLKVKTFRAGPSAPPAQATRPVAVCPVPMNATPSSVPATSRPVTEVGEVPSRLAAPLPSTVTADADP